MLSITPIVQSPAAFWRYVSASVLKSRITRALLGEQLYPRTAQEVAAGITPTDYAYEPGDIRRYGAVCDGDADDTAAVVAALAANKKVTLFGQVKITSTLTVNRQHRISGTGEGGGGTSLQAWGCDAILIPNDDGAGANGNGVRLDGFDIYSYAGDGTPDPRTHKAVVCEGDASESVSYFYARKVYVQGFATGFDWQYTWNSVLENCDAVNCDVGLRLFGQSVNNSVSNSRLVCNGGAECVLLEADGSTVGEGLMITGSLLASGDYGVRCTNGFLSLNIAGCVIDLIQDVAFKLVDCRALCIGQSWVYAANKCVEFAALSVEVISKACIDGSHLHVTEDDARCVEIGANNRGVTINGGSLVSDSTGYLVHNSANSVAVNGVHAAHGGSGAAFWLEAGSQFRVTGCTGDVEVSSASGKPATGAVVAMASITGATGVAAYAVGCATSRTGTGTYQVTFTEALTSAAYVPMVLPRRTGADAWTFEITAISESGFTFEIRDETGTAFDPTDVYLTVHY